MPSRNPFLQAFVDINCSLLLNNPINDKIYAFLLFIQACEILMMPLNLLFVEGTTTVYSLFFNLQNQLPVIIYTFMLLGLQSTLLISIIFMWMIRFFKIREYQQKGNKMYLSQENDEPFKYQRFIVKFVFSLFILIQTIVVVPLRTMAIRSVFRMAQLEINIPSLYSSSLLTLGFDIIQTIYYSALTQTLFPIQKQVPWAQAFPHGIIVHEIAIYLVCFMFGIRQSLSVIFYFYAITSIIAFLAMFYVQTYYDSLIMHFKKLIQGTIFSSLLILSFALSRDPNFRGELVVILLILIILLYLCQVIVHLMIKNKRLFISISSTKPQSQGIQWLWAIENEFVFNQNTNLEKINKYIVHFQTFIIKHIDICDNQDCKCKTSKKIQLLINDHHTFQDKHQYLKQLKMHMIALQLKAIQKIVIQNKVDTSNKDLQFLQIYYSFKLNKNYLSCVYNLNKIHNCKSCGMFECIQYNILKRLIFNKFQKLQMKEKQDNIIKFHQIVHFETSFKLFIKSVLKLIDNTHNFWSLIQRKQLDIIKSDIIGRQLFNSYQRFKQIYSKMKVDCGDVLQIENISCRLHQSVLNFEQESIMNFETVKLLLNKVRVGRKSINESQFQLNLRILFMVVSANPENFHQITNINKALLKFTNYNDESIIGQKLQALMPSSIAYSHEQIVRKYLKRQLFTSVSLKQLWIVTKNKTVKPVNITVIPRYDLINGITLNALVVKSKNINVFNHKIKQNAVFCFLFDINDKVIYISDNCRTQLKVNYQVDSEELSIYQIFLNLPMELVNEETYVSQLNYNLLLKQNNDYDVKKDNTLINVQLQYIEKSYGQNQHFRQILFVILKDTTNIQNKNIRTLIYDSQQHIFNSKGTTEDENQQTHQAQEQSEDSSIIKEEIASISSTASSGTSSKSAQDLQINEIKSAIEFDELPKSLRIYRLKLIVVFILIAITGFVLLAVNIYSKDRFKTDLLALQVEKRMRNNFSKAKFNFLYLYGAANQPKNFNYDNTVLVKVPNNDLVKFFSDGLKDSITRLQQFLSLFSQNSDSWDETLVQMFNVQELKLEFITTQGNYIVEDYKFQQGMTLFVGNMDYINNVDSDYLKMNFNIFEMNSIEKMKSKIKQATTEVKILFLTYITV